MFFRSNGCGDTRGEIRVVYAKQFGADPGSIAAVWGNYELVGNLWASPNGLPPFLQTQGGALSAANTAMETFVQNGEAAVTNPNNCFSCHNMDPPAGTEFGKTLPPAGLAHIFDKVQANTGGCDDGSLPAACSPYYAAN